MNIMLQLKHIFTRSLIYIFLACLTLSTNAQAYLNDIATKIHSLKPFIGDYPPKVASEDELNKIKKLYHEYETEINKLVSLHPKDIDLLLTRARLYSMGHNLDAPNAFKNSERDFIDILKTNPEDLDAIIELAVLYVNTPSYAPNAEKLYLAAECLLGENSRPGVYIGLAFACYYQGKFDQALKAITKAEKLSPKDKNIKLLKNVIQDVLKRKKSQ